MGSVKEDKLGKYLVVGFLFVFALYGLLRLSTKNHLLIGDIAREAGKYFGYKMPV